ncbi:hypothetical protein BC828DRAFT_399343 [Blastocladiella britannica]|nr:hypothetical protein BC828DRAFT_399343 [Blastocladiella britannica]
MFAFPSDPAYPTGTAYPADTDLSTKLGAIFEICSSSFDQHQFVSMLVRVVLGGFLTFTPTDQNVATRLHRLVTTMSRKPDLQAFLAVGQFYTELMEIAGAIDYSVAIALEDTADLEGTILISGGLEDYSAEVDQIPDHQLLESAVALGHSIGSPGLPRPLAAALACIQSLLDPRVAEYISLANPELEANFASAATSGDKVVWEMLPSIANGAATAVSIQAKPITMLGITVLCWALQQPGQNLIAMHLDNTSIGDAGARVLAACLPSTLDSLSLCGNGIGDVGATALAQALPRGLTKLSLSANQIGDIGAFELGRNLPPSLLVLRFHSNQIGDNGVEQLAPSLHDTQLQELLLAWNKITDDGALAIAAHLPRKLAILSLRGNEITDYGAMVLAEHLPLSLRELYLIGNDIGLKGQTTIKTVWSQRSSALTI